MNARLPIFTDNIKNVPKEDAADLRFFAGEMMIPVAGWKRSDCYHMIRKMVDNKKLHPHLRYRARHALNVGKTFIKLQNDKVKMATMKASNRDHIRINTFDQNEFKSMKPELRSVDIVMNDISGQVIVPENAEKMALAVKIISINLHTERKFEVFAEVVKTALELVFGDLDDFIERLATPKNQFVEGQLHPEHEWVRKSQNIHFFTDGQK